MHTISPHGEKLNWFLDTVKNSAQAKIRQQLNVLIVLLCTSSTLVAGFKSGFVQVVVKE